MYPCFALCKGSEWNDIRRPYLSLPVSEWSDRRRPYKLACVAANRHRHVALSDFVAPYTYSKEPCPNRRPHGNK